MTIWSAADPRFSPMLIVARRLGKVRDKVLFLGGAVVPLLITDGCKSRFASWSRPRNPREFVG